MKKTNNILYITDNYLYLKNKKYPDTIKYKINKNIVINGKIANVNKFNKCYESLLNEYKLSNSLLGDTIKIIINPTYTLADITILKNIFNNFNYRHIDIINETKYYKLNQSNAYLNIYDSYMILTFINEYKKNNSLLIPDNFFDDLDELMEYINKKIKNKELYLIGKGERLEDFFNSFEDKYNVKTYMYTDNEYYLINSAAR